MISFLTVLHILITVSLCALVLVQDSKGGGALGIGGGGSNSLLGATGAQSLAAKLTRIVAIFFAVSCVALTYFLAHDNKSVVDQLGAQAITSPATENKPADVKVPDSKEASPQAQPAAAQPSATQTATTPTASTESKATAPAAAGNSTKESAQGTSQSTSGQAPANVKK